VEIWEIVRLSEWRSLEVGTVVMKEGEPGNYFCVLVEGRLRVLKQGHLLNTLSPGDCFGEMALFAAGRGARTSSVEATSEARILTIRAPRCCAPRRCARCISTRASSKSSPPGCRWPTAASPASERRPRRPGNVGFLTQTARARAQPGAI
jgi:hypothetical protein